jgi:protein-L-isoaspartate(D-aspartate) O-methyltransferase
MLAETMCIKRLLVLMLLALGGVVCAATSDGEDEVRRQRMVREIEADVKRTGVRLGQSVLQTQVLEAMRRVPRHAFVSPALRHQAYENRPLPIGHGQTISQPYIVAVMTELLSVDKADLVLEVGTGSGYQAAILAELVQHVYSVEIIPELAEEARARLQRLGYTNITVRPGDGYYGWEERAPFDTIIVTAAASHIPPPLLRQLKPGGRMVIPVGTPFLTQQLMLVHKNADGQITTRQVLPVAFVPLMGKH